MPDMKCLKCDESVLIPAGASLQATVLCPLCHEQFILGDMLDALPPALEVVNDPEAEQSPEVKPFNFDFEGRGEQPTDDIQVSDGEASDSPAAAVPAFQFEDSAPAGSTGEAKTYRPAARPKRKEKNPIVEMAKVVGGGVLGILIAILGIWWIGKQDPFKLGPKVAEIAPWIVPEELRGGGDADDDGEEPEQNGKLQDQNKNRPSGRPPRTTNQGENEHIARGDLSQSPFNDQGEPADKNSPKKEDDNKQRKENDNQTQPTNPVRIKIADVTTPKSFKQSVDIADVALTKWAPEEDFDTEAFRQDAFKAIDELGKNIACSNQADPLNESSIQRTRGFLTDLRGKEKKLGIINSWTAKQLASGDADLQGVLLAGEVKSIENQGVLWETQVELLTESQEPIAVITLQDPSNYCPPGSKIVMIGAIVRDPITNLLHYGGENSTVVCSGWLELLEASPVEN